MRQKISAIIVNGLLLPAPDDGVTMTEATYGEFKRNANLEMRGQRKGDRDLWKIDTLEWAELSVEEWAEIKEALKPFFVPVTFYTDTNGVVNCTMYPSDRKAQPTDWDEQNKRYRRVKNCKLNLIDCGY